MNPVAMTSTFEPNELAFLKRIFDVMCVERGLSGASPAASDLAAQVIQLYQFGLKDERSLQTHFQAGR